MNVIYYPSIEINTFRSSSLFSARKKILYDLVIACGFFELSELLDNDKKYLH